VLQIEIKKIEKSTEFDLTSKKLKNFCQSNCKMLELI